MKTLATTLLTFLCLAQVIVAQPEARPEKVESSQEVVTRSELVQQLESVLKKDEIAQDAYARKGEVSELRRLLLQLREELDGLGIRTTGTLEELEQRSQNLSRPGF